MRRASFGFDNRALTARPRRSRAGRAIGALLGGLLAIAVAPPVASAAALDAGTLVAALRAVPLPAGSRLVEAPAAIDGAEAAQRLESAGYEIAVAIPPSVYIVRLARRAGPLPAGFLPRDASPPAPGAPPVGASAGTGDLSTAGVSDFDPFNGVGDALPPLLGSRAPSSARVPRRSGSAPSLPEGLFYGTRWDDLSEFFVGRVGIGILFPESDGSLDQNRYDWTPALRDSVVRSAVRGFLGWSDFAAARGIPLSFFLEIHASLPTKYEPISRPTSQEELWIADMLSPVLGYSGDALTMTTDLSNGIRSRLGTQWAGLAIAVQNDSSSTGTFPDGLIAHARIGGPWFVIPVNNLRTTSATLDFYMRHEITHLFWALDEYPANNAWWSCTLSTGYFNRPNWNSSIPLVSNPLGYCGYADRCLMRGNYPDDLCQFTAQQIGWVDLDQTGVIDLYETRPLVVPDSVKYRLTAGNPLLLHGRVGETALPNVNPYHSFSGDSISVSVIDSILYRVDGGPWTPISPVDGRFDEGSEDFNFTLAPLPIGSHTIDWQARNRNGLLAAVNATTAVTVSGSAGAVDPTAAGSGGALRLAVGPSPGRGPIRFSLTGTGGAPAQVRIWTATGVLARAWTIGAGTGAGAWTWDGRLAGGVRAPSGVYFITVDSERGRLRRRLVFLR